MKKVSKILSVMLMVSLMFVLLNSTVLATEYNYQDILDVLNVDTNNTTNTTAANTTNNTVNNIVENTNTNASTNETLPKTGVTEDYAIIAFAVVCGISAIYAYKKVKKYNVK